MTVSFIGASAPVHAVGDGPNAARWSAEQTWQWYKQQPWLVGFNYVPSTACNTTEWWQADTFDPETIERELGWAEDLGFNTIRCFVQYLVWKHDPHGLPPHGNHPCNG
jgi:hypothetical protein